MKKRIFAAVTALVLALTFMTACAQNGGEENLPAPGESAVGTSAPETEQETEPETAAPETEAPETTAEETEKKEETEMTQAVTTLEPAATTEAATTAAPATTAPETTAPETTTEAFKVEAASGKMYAVEDVNVRTGPAATYDRVGHLDKGDGVEITGRAENGWYRIKFKGGEYFVGGSYLSENKPAAATTAATTAATAAATTAPTAASEVTTAEPKPAAKQVWVSTWGSAMLRPTANDQIPSNPKLENNTVRQQIRVSIGGKKLKLVISNEFGETDLKIDEIKISKLNNPRKPDVDLETEKALTVDGSGSFKVKAGSRVTTDELDFEFSALEDLAITMKLGSVPSTLTCHTASRCSTWVVSGNHVSDNSYSVNQTMTAWYFITRLDTLADEGSGAIVCLGDSLTDGASVTTNAFSRYTDELARKLNSDPELNNLGVVNMGIGGTALYTYGDDSGRNRLKRDVLDTPGAKYCVLLYGINDIGGAQSDISQNIINEYKNIIERCHEKGIKVFGCTLTPMKGNGYYSDAHEKIRLAVNKFVLSSDSGFDGVIDLSSAVASSSDSAKMDDKYVSVWNDYLHFNDSGYKHVGQTVYENIKNFIAKSNGVMSIVR